MSTASSDDILFVGDVHLGRRPVGLDIVLREHFPFDAFALSPAGALTRTVDHALALPPRAVVFVGDLVDQEEDRFEAYAILEREVSRLADKGIAVLVIAGNHDGLVLPRLVERVRGVRLLGAGGTWERVELEGGGRPVDLLGWSFPERHHRGCPLDEASFEIARSKVRPGALALGVLHTDLDQAASPYAPVSREQLERARLHGWLLGHIHAPGDLAASQPVGYLGSLVGLDGGETGPHGPWRVRPAGDGVECEHVPLAPVRFEDVDVELGEDDGDDDNAAHERLEHALRERLRRLGLADAGPLLVVARARLVGRPRGRQGAKLLARRCAEAPLVFPILDPPVVVRRVENLTRPPIDLDALVRESTPIGGVARALVELREGRADELLERADDRVAVVRSSGWDVNSNDHPAPPTAQLLESAAWRLLDVLLEQRREEGEA